MSEISHSPTVSFWCDQIAIYEREFKKWEGRSNKIVKRYKDDRNDAENARARFNILWSNVQTLAPALYAKHPIPNVDRRYESDDEEGTTTARVIERAVTYFVETELFDSVMTQCVLDRLLPGRGVAWVRYDFKDQAGSAEVTDDEESEIAAQGDYTENVVIDYVHWKDYGHTWARTEEEIRGKWRKVYMTRKEMKDRGFKNADKIPLDYQEKKNADDGGMNEMGAKKATVYEIWDKSTKTAIWINKNSEEVLDELDDPLGLQDFFPCPKPLYSTLANDNLIPTPDYIQYQDQAKELDELTGRINSITKALKVIGVYDKSAEGLSRLLTEGLENTMVPVEQWAAFAEKGGMKGVVDWFPLEMVINTVVSLYEAREKVKQDLYEITGISDIIRGSGDPNETATASNLKGQYATLRLNSQQKDVARFARDLVRIMAEIICKHFSIDTIKQISGMKLLQDAEKQMIMAKAQQPGPPGPDGQPAPPAPIPDEIQELLDQPTWEEVEKLLRNDTLRCFRISIETDSTIKSDQEAEKNARVEMITAVGGYMQQAALLPPQLQPLAAEILMFGIRGFKIARDIETTFDVALKKIKQAADAPPPPNPDDAKNQIDLKKHQDNLQMEGAKLQAEGQKTQVTAISAQTDAQLKAKELALKEQELASNHQLAHRKIDADILKAKLTAKTKAAPDVAMSDPEMHDGQTTPMAQMMQGFAQMMMTGFQQIAAQQAQGNQQIIAAISAPKKTEVIRDAQGRISAGVQTVQ